MHQVGLFRQLTDRVTLFLDDAFEPDRETRERLDARDIRVVRGPVVGLETSLGRLAGIRLEDGEIVAVDVLTVQPRFVARSEVLASLGVGTVPMEMAGRVVAEHVPTDPTGLTSAPGVWAAGNVAQPQAQVGASAAGGVMAAAMVNADLVEEDVERAVQSRLVS